MQNLEADKSIAKFLDINVRVFQDILLYDEHPQVEKVNVFSPYDDWNDLMLAVNKIEKLGFKFKMCRSRVMVYYDETPETSPIFEVKGVNKHSAAYSAVGNFIKWQDNKPGETGQIYASRTTLLARKIEAGIKAKGMSKKDFAAAMNVVPSRVTKWIGGDNNFTVGTLFLIEDVLGIKLVNV